MDKLDDEISYSHQKQISEDFNHFSYSVQICWHHKASSNTEPKQTQQLVSSQQQQASTQPRSHLNNNSTDSSFANKQAKIHLRMSQCQIHASLIMLQNQSQTCCDTTTVLFFLTHSIFHPSFTVSLQILKFALSIIYVVYLNCSN